MQLEEVIRNAQREAQQAAERLDHLRAEIAALEATYGTAMQDLKVLEDIAARYGASGAVAAESAGERPSPWGALNRQEAVARAMEELGHPVRLPDLVDYLQARGRRDTVHLVSATMAALKRKGLVNSIERGVWRLSPTSIAPPLPDSLLSRGPVEDTG